MSLFHICVVADSEKFWNERFPRFWLLCIGDSCNARDQIKGLSWFAYCLCFWCQSFYKFGHRHVLYFDNPGQVPTLGVEFLLTIPWTTFLPRTERESHGRVLEKTGKQLLYHSIFKYGAGSVNRGLRQTSTDVVYLHCIYGTATGLYMCKSLHPYTKTLRRYLQPRRHMPGCHKYTDQKKFLTRFK